MCQYSAVDGLANDWRMIHIGNMALSGAGMLFIEATAVEPAGRITPGGLGLWDGVTEAAMRPILAAVRRYSRIPITLQLSHAGR
jgi:2,4-dienoyl-CoA reductase-like NADH-dependent reductase (Old Yellow Enzyme family)